MHHLPDAFAPLAAYRQFIVYHLVWNEAKRKNDKFPVDYRTGRMPIKGGGGAHDPAIWTDAQTAIDAAARFGAAYGVGFVFTPHDPFWFLDIDGCLSPDGTTWSPLSQQLCAAFPGAAIEVSSSCHGLHIIGSGAASPHGCKNIPFGLEFYTEGRFVALTGYHATGSAAADFSDRLPNLVAQFFPPASSSESLEWTDAPCAGWNGPDDDEELLRRAMRSQSAAAAFGNKASFRDLYECNVDTLVKAYPASSADSSTPYDASSVDRALAQHLAFWTGRNCERIRRLMERSALVRDKWSREDYLPRTITRAVSAQREVLTDKEPEPIAAAYVPTPSAPAAGEPAKASLVTGSTFLSIDQQMELFRGCVYIYDMNRILVPGGMMFKPDQFRVMYGGYSFPMDFANERNSRDAYETFTQSQAFRGPRADSTCFRPNRAAGEIIQEAGLSRVNTYWPIEVPRQVGDVSPFLTHLAKLLPDERDRTILLSYMAACVQYKGYKIQWAPLLQGTEGNGKTLLTRCVAEAIGRRYVHWPKASKLSNQFNGWMRGRLFFGVEDIFVPGNRFDVINELRPMITGDNLEIEGKGVDQEMADICGNFMFNTNHKDGMIKTRNDRRFAPFFTAQQSVDDLARDGLTATYFHELYEWLRREGYAIVSELLHTFPIEDRFNPTTQCQRAPDTTSTLEAINESLGSVEQEILEAIAQGLSGFRGGWVSSMALNGLLDSVNASRRVPHNRRREIMGRLGYVYHPGLIDGRVHNTVMPDGGKPRLFIHIEHAGRHLLDGGAIAKAYSEAQGVPTALVMGG